MIVPERLVEGQCLDDHVVTIAQKHGEAPSTRAWIAMAKVELKPNFDSAKPLESLGLTAREAEVLLWVAQGFEPRIDGAKSAKRGRMTAPHNFSLQPWVDSSVKSSRIARETVTRELNKRVRIGSLDSNEAQSSLWTLVWLDCVCVSRIS
jgi:hypothetical protein